MYATEAKLADCCVNCGMPTQVTYLSTTFSGAQLKRGHDVCDKHYQNEPIINAHMLSNLFRNEDPLLGTHLSFVY
jgi:hypothetical protein